MKYRVQVYVDRFPPVKHESPVDSETFEDYEQAREWFNYAFVGWGNYTAFLDVRKRGKSGNYWLPSEEWHS